MVAGTNVPLWGMEIDPDESTKRFRASSAADKGQVSPAAGDAPCSWLADGVSRPVLSCCAADLSAPACQAPLLPEQTRQLFAPTPLG